MAHAQNTEEDERAEEVARLHTALATAQDQSFWLDRFHIDLNRLMAGRGATQIQVALRTVRALRAWTYRVKQNTSDMARDVQAAAHAEGADVAPFADPPLLGEFERTISPRPLRTSMVTDVLYERLGEADVAAVREVLEADEASSAAHANAADERRLLLAFGVHHEVPDVIEATGLSAAMPPSDVHAMGRGAMAAGGSPYYADLIVDALEASGFSLGEGQRALDFGCSSGRVVRVLAAAYPPVEWLGCDPIPDAIEWSKSHLPGIEFAQSPEEPPLPYDDESLDVIYAVSIWSHFAEAAALTWLTEMRRLIRPGGRLVLSSHGLQSLAHDATFRGEGQLREIRSALSASGFWFKDEFGEARDHGVGGAEWGTAFFTAEWLIANILDSWRLVGFAAGRLEDNQDLYVLEPR